MLWGDKHSGAGQEVLTRRGIPGGCHPGLTLLSGSLGLFCSRCQRPGMVPHSSLLLLMRLQIQPLGYFRNQVQFSSEKPLSSEREQEEISSSPKWWEQLFAKHSENQPWGDMTLQEINECEANAFKSTHLSSSTEKTGTLRKNQ